MTGVGATVFGVALIVLGLLLYYHILVIGTTLAIVLGWVFGGIIGLVVLAAVVSWIWFEFVRP